MTHGEKFAKLKLAKIDYFAKKNFSLSPKFVAIWYIYYSALMNTMCDCERSNHIFTYDYCDNCDNNCEPYEL